MRFFLTDRVLELVPHERIRVVKSLAMAEEYLADHFPTAPVMPGVMMLEVLVQASAWLIRASDEFAHSMVVLKEARSIKYANFVQPGQILDATVSVVKQQDDLVTLKGQGTVNDQVCVSGRLVMRRFNLADADPTLAARDAFCIARQKELYALIQPTD